MEASIAEIKNERLMECEQLYTEEMGVTIRGITLTIYTIFALITLFKHGKSVVKLNKWLLILWIFDHIWDFVYYYLKWTGIFENLWMNISWKLFDCALFMIFLAIYFRLKKIQIYMDEYNKTDE